jgi:hypothetical protein
MNLYKLTNNLGEWYVIAEDPTKAQRALEYRLRQEGYGFDNYRKVFKIEKISEMVKPALNSKWFFSSGNKLVVPELEKVELLNKLLNLKNEYIKLLGNEVDKFAEVSYMHGVYSSQEDINKGKELREEMKKIKEELEEI